MAAIKAGDGLQDQANALRASGTGLNGTSADVSTFSTTLPACGKFAAMLEKIESLAKLYGQLAEKDAGEIDSFIRNMKTQDNSGG